MDTRDQPSHSSINCCAWPETKQPGQAAGLQKGLTKLFGLRCWSGFSRDSLPYLFIIVRLRYGRPRNSVALDCVDAITTGVVVDLELGLLARLLAEERLAKRSQVAQNLVIRIAIPCTKQDECCLLYTSPSPRD